MRRTLLILVAMFASLVLLAAACGSDSSDEESAETTGDSDEASTEAEEPDPPAEDAADDSDQSASEPEPEEPEAEAPDDSEAAAPPPPSGDTGAVLNLENGETYTFSVLCYLETQEAAGSEILFTAASYDNPSLDITQFGDEGTVTGVSVVSVYDAESYDTLYEASSSYEGLGGTLTLTLEGSTITGIGDFYPAGDPGVTPVPGEIVANC